jgi:5-(carboxyamino)imidazole ribonucleotide synthase
MHATVLIRRGAARRMVSFLLRCVRVSKATPGPADRFVGVDVRTGLPVVGMVGAGQLARMTHQAAIGLGQSLKVLAESGDDGAASVACSVEVGDYRCLADLRRFSLGCDVVTFDHEHVPAQHLESLSRDGVTVLPPAHALRFAQDKAAMRARLTDLGLPCPPWRDLGAAPDPGAALAEFGDRVGWPLVVKASVGGYDGRGVWVLASLDEATALLASGRPLLAEALVDIDFEVASVVARSPFGQGAAWPVVETVQRQGICTEVLAPAPGLSSGQAERAQALALTIAGALDVVGILAVELFITRSGETLINELAMRPHNSGHWTIEGSRTSQFEQHLRAVLDYPMGSTDMTAPFVVMANVLGGPEQTTPALDERVHHLMARWPDVKIHLYGKTFRPGRKVGHVTALGTDLGKVRARASAAASYLSAGEQSGFGADE